MRADGGIALDERLSLVALGDEPPERIERDPLVFYGERFDEQPFVRLLNEGVLGKAHIPIRPGGNGDLSLTGHFDPLRLHLRWLRHRSSLPSAWYQAFGILA